MFLGTRRVGTAFIASAELVSCRLVWYHVHTLRWVEGTWQGSWTSERSTACTNAATWTKDFQEKPDLYGHLGVQEYFAYDPNPVPLASATRARLFGWRLDPLLGRMLALRPHEDGSLWSRELESFLLADGGMLRLYDRNLQLRLTEAEAQAQARWAAEEQARMEMEARWAAEQRAQAEAERANALLEKLRSLGIDPDKL